MSGPFFLLVQLFQIRARCCKKARNGIAEFGSYGVGFAFYWVLVRASADTFEHVCNIFVRVRRNSCEVADQFHRNRTIGPIERLRLSNYLAEFFKRLP